MGGILVLVLSLSMAVTQDKPVAAAEQYRALLKESGAFRLELTAYEGQTQIDSGSLDVQVLSDPREQQNPLPNREFLAALAHETDGRVIEDANALTDVLMEPPVVEGSPIVRRTPLWSRSWVLGGLLALLAGEWFWRRWLGLA